MKGLILLTGIVFCFLYSYSQEIKFKFVEDKGEFKEVIFAVVGITDDTHSNQIIELFEGRDEIVSCKMFYNKRCKMVVHSTFTPDEASEYRQLLLSQNVDLDINYVIVENKSIYLDLIEKKKNSSDTYVFAPIPSNEWQYPPSFPKYTDTGNSVADSKNYALQKQQWIEDHPEEYKLMTGKEYLDLINQ